jgi:hypothetical protein
MQATKEKGSGSVSSLCLLCHIAIVPLLQNSELVSDRNPKKKKKREKQLSIHGRISDGNIFIYM